MDQKTGTAGSLELSLLLAGTAADGLLSMSIRQLHECHVRDTVPAASVKG